MLQCPACLRFGYNHTVQAGLWQSACAWCRVRKWCKGSVCVMICRLLPNPLWGIRSAGGAAARRAAAHAPSARVPCGDSRQTAVL